MELRKDAEEIIQGAIGAALPDAAVRRAMEQCPLGEGKVVLVSVGKAAWQMAKAAADLLGDRISAGVVVTKYGHSMGPVSNFEIIEAGHPVPDENSFRGAEAAIRLVSGLTPEDLVLFLVSGGGSALFEKPLVSPEELTDITQQLLACGADIVEINTIRKRISAVKGGKFGQLCAPARVFSIILSDILGDPLDMIASGPAYPDSSTAADAVAIAEKYHLRLSPEARRLLEVETPKKLDHVTSCVTGSVRQLCASAKETCEKLGYEPIILTDCLSCEAREAGAFLGAIARTYGDSSRSMAFIAGGETVVHLTGKGKGGRNQELALAAAELLDGVAGAAVFSVGSDGTDGPTDAAGGYVDSFTKAALKEKGISIYETLAENDAYHALQAVNGLIMTGPTGTNVNDLSVLLLKR